MDLNLIITGFVKVLGNRDNSIESSCCTWRFKLVCNQDKFHYYYQMQENSHVMLPNANKP